jgi:deoxyribodipyrimidine photo-lyase
MVILQSLEDLDQELTKFGTKINLIQDELIDCLISLWNVYPFEAIFFNEDYTPLSIRREEAIKKFAQEKQISWISNIDYPLVDPRLVKTKSNKPYKVFTPFYNNSKKIEITLPEEIPEKSQFSSLSNHQIKKISDIKEKWNLRETKIIGGRTKALEKLSKITDAIRYLEERDFPAKNSTSGLSTYIRFGNLSIREVYHFIGSQLENPGGLIRQLYWRDFYTYIGFHFPHVYQTNFNQKYKFLSWENNPDLFDRWIKGMTGFPIVDAGIRQLNETGLMHNRVRMIVASFLVKDLLIDWKWGERYFAKQLLDYDPAVNNGSWQWASSTGTDAQPYFRIFNPWRQQKKYDPNCDYIKKWIPELRDFEPKIIHNLFKQRPKTIAYPKPIVDHGERAKLAKLMFKK